MEESQICNHLISDIEYDIKNKKIFKDQCLKCYDDPRSEKGLNICLKCFDGCCYTREDNHSNYIYRKKIIIFI